MSVQTLCKDCIFAVKNRGKQTGCKLGRLDKFIADGKAEQDGKTYVITRRCTTCRDKAWGVKHKGREVESVLEEVKFSYDAVIYDVSGEKFSSVQSRLSKTLDSLLKQTILPENLTIYIEPPGIGKAVFSWVDKHPIRDKVKTSVKVGSTDMEDEDDRIFLGIEGTTQKVKTPYYSVIQNGGIFPDGYFATLDKWQNEELKPFLLIVTEIEGSLFTCQSLIHRLLDGSMENYHILDKIADRVSLTNSRHLILEYTGE